MVVINKIDNIIVTIRFEEANRKADFDLPLDESLEEIMKFVYPALLQVANVDEEYIASVNFYFNEKKLDKNSTLRENEIWDGHILKIY